MSMFEAMNLPISFESAYYASEAWDDRKKQLEEEALKQTSLMKLGNEIIKGLNGLGKRR